jgi:hypothetical protein
MSRRGLQHRLRRLEQQARQRRSKQRGEAEYVDKARRMLALLTRWASEEGRQETQDRIARYAQRLETAQGGEQQQLAIELMSNMYWGRRHAQQDELVRQADLASDPRRP